MIIIWHDLPYFVKMRAKDFGDLQVQFDKVSEWQHDSIDAEHTWSAAWSQLNMGKRREILVKIRFELRRAIQSMSGLLQ
jgi:hypothetical protein